MLLLDDKFCIFTVDGDNLNNLVQVIYIFESTLRENNLQVYRQLLIKNLETHAHKDYLFISKILHLFIISKLIKIL